ncbi:F-box family protein [Rhynchospora pubera]|uniref:F-box family protein n=1 Tax=Rhynchospora pubera TaxID=906938 RepID=A0AAV8CV05_9POAL|nr:F-box family protein [Rhynchospora pubera]KAJ4759856.1 F-box family protein [Rhynchospora pubera]KAJ4759859.1 F-box family protein [Rhynchospora pubera]
MEAIETSVPLESQKRVGVDWSDLPVDLLQEILKKLHDIFDFVYFRAICKKWRAATSISDLPPQLPWLLQEHRSGSESLCFYSLLSDKIRTIHCPMACNKHLIGPSHGYLYAEGLPHSLLNPLTKDEVTIEPGSFVCPFLVCMGPDPIGSNDYMAFLHNDLGTARFYRPRSCEWNSVALPLNDVGRESCLKGMYYMKDHETDNTVVFNIACGSSFVIPSPKILDSSDQVYFVESSGKILRIVKSVDLSSPVSTPNYCFNIYQLDVEGEIDQGRWVKTNSIGNQILFLDFHNGISITASPSTGFRGNYVYYIVSPDDECFVSCGLYKYNISDGQAEKVLCPFNNGWTWLVPNLVSSLPAGHN